MLVQRLSMCSYLPNLLTEAFFLCFFLLVSSLLSLPPSRVRRSGEQSSSITPACFVPMWAGLPWPRVDSVLDGKGGGNGGGGGGGGAQGVRLARCVESLRGSGLVQAGGVCTSLEVRRALVP